MTDQEKTLDAIEETLRKWIEKQIPVYEQLPAAQTMTSTQGEKVLKINPAVQEIRAAFRDYCFIVKTQQEMKGSNNHSAKVSKLEDLRSQIKMVGSA